MDILHAQIIAIQNRLSFVQEDPIDWRAYVLVFSWGICLFESYLLYVLLSFFFFFPFKLTLATENSSTQPTTISTLLEISPARYPIRSLYT
jgi:hypothetical protein